MNESYHTWLETVGRQASRQTPARALTHELASRALDGVWQPTDLAPTSPEYQDLQYKETMVTWVRNSKSGAQLPIITPNQIRQFGKDTEHQATATRVENWILTRHRRSPATAAMPFIFLGDDLTTSGLRADRLTAFVEELREGKVFFYQARSAVAEFLADYAKQMIEPKPE